MSDIAPLPVLIPKQLAVLNRIVEMLEELPLTGSDTETFKGRVYIGRTVFGKETDLPAFSILESTRPDLAPVTAGENKIDQSTLWTLLLQGFVKDDKKNPTVPAYWLKAQAEQRLSAIIAKRAQSPHPVSPEDYLIPLDGVKLITGLAIGPGVVRPPDEISPNAYFYLPLVVNLVINVANPFVAQAASA